MTSDSFLLKSSPALVIVLGLLTVMIPEVLWADPSRAEKADAPVSREISPLATQGPQPKPFDPPSPEEIDDAIKRGVVFLLADQRPDGS